MEPDPLDPEFLEVQWLEHGVLVHALTMAASTAPLAYANGLALGAMVAGFGAVASWQAGWVLPAAGGAVLGLVATGALGRIALAQSKTRPAAPQRVLVEITPDKVGYTLMASDRWSMHHDHERRLADLQSVAAAETPLGGVVLLRLAEETLTIPLYGVPFGDVRWLVARVEEARASQHLAFVEEA